MQATDAARKRWPVWPAMAGRCDAAKIAEAAVAISATPVFRFWIQCDRRPSIIDRGAAQL